MQLGGYKLFPGDLVMVDYNGIHEAAFKNANDFIPERWMEEEKVGADDEKKWFLTFSAGDRLCIGMRFALLEMQLFLVMLISKGYWWKLEPKQDLNWLPRDGLSKKYVSGVKLIFQKLSDCRPPSK